MPIGLRKPPNQAYVTLKQRYAKQPEDGRLMKSRLSPVAQFAIRRSQFLRKLCCDQTNDHVRPMAMVKLVRQHHGWPNLRRVCAWKGADHDVTWPQNPSRYCLSNPSRGEVNGSGLGLAIAKWIAGAHHAQLSVQSRQHQGTQFRVEFALLRDTE